MTTQNNTPTPIPVVLDEWRAWDRLRLAIERRNDNPNDEAAKLAVREATIAFIETCGERVGEV